VTFPLRNDCSDPLRHGGKDNKGITKQQKKKKKKNKYGD
jgi:hypothetical protein